MWLSVQGRVLNLMWILSSYKTLEMTSVDRDSDTDSDHRKILPARNMNANPRQTKMEHV